MDEALAGRSDRGSSRDGGHRALARRADAAGERSGGDRPADLQAVRGGAHQGRAIRGARTRGADPGKRGGRGGRPGKVLAAPAEGWLAATLERKHSQDHEMPADRDPGKRPIVLFHLLLRTTGRTTLS